MKSNNPARRTRRSTFSMEQLEQRQLLSAALSVSNSLVVFNAVKNVSAGMTQTITLTDTGSTTLDLTSVSIAADPAGVSADAARFTIANASSIPAQLTAGQSVPVQVTYVANAAPVLNKALLNVVSDDSTDPADTTTTASVSLHGLGAVSTSGTGQPSLPAILRAYNIPTITGDGANDANIFLNGAYPQYPDASSQEVVMQRLVKAGAGPVTIQVLGSFTAAGAHPYTLGTYTPGNPNARQELFYTPSTQNQSTAVTPQGATSFDPGGNPFGFYFVSNVEVVGRLGYTEDAFNTWDTHQQRKFRFFPLENADGSTVPNAYVMTSTEYDQPGGYDFTNIVAVVRNVQAAPNTPTAPAIGLQDLNALPGQKNMIFDVIHSPNTSLGDDMHNIGTLKVNNTGGQPLVITSYTLSSKWTLVSPPTLPITIAAGSSLNLSIQFDALTNPSVPYNETSSPSYPTGGGVYSGTITLTSNDPTTPVVSMPLAGWWQYHSENNNEPSLQSIVNLLAGWSTNINSTPIPELSESQSVPSSPTYYGEEVISGLWAAADPTQAVNVRKIAGYHTEGNTDTTSWYYHGTGTSVTYKSLFTTASDAGQMLFPYVTGTTTPATASFTTTNTFGFRVDNEFSEDGMNGKISGTLATGGGHHFRFYPVRDAAGNLVAGTYIMTMDYSNTPQNFDFQDNVYIVSNIRPAGLPPTPVDTWASSSTSGVSIQWAPATYSTLTGYNVYRGTSVSGTYSLLTNSPVTTANYLDTTAASGTTYYYHVTSVATTPAGSDGTPAATFESVAATATTAVPTASTGGTSTGTGHPVAASVTLSTSAGINTSVNVAAKATDYNATLLPSTVIVTSQPTHGTAAVDTNTGTITYTPTGGFTGMDAFQYTIADSTGAVSSAAVIAVNVTAQPVGDPVGANLSLSTAYQTPLTVNILTAASDDTATLLASTLTITTPPTNGTATVNATTGVITYTPAAGYSGSDSFGYTIGDTLQAVSQQATVAVTVAPQLVVFPPPPITLPPVAPTLSSVTAGANAATFDVVSGATGATINASTVTVTTAPAHGVASVDATTGLISYHANAGYVGADALSYTLADTNGLTSAPATLSLNVGVAIGGATKSLTFTDTGGSVVTLTLTGAGSATVYFNGNGSYSTNAGKVLLTGSGLSISSIAATGTGAGTGLTVARRGASVTALGDISITGSLGRLIAPTASLNGDLSVTGGLGTLQLAGVNDSAISVGTDAGIPAGLNFTTGAVTGATLTSTEPVRSIKAVSWSGDAITAPSISSLTIAGNFSPTLTLSGGSPFALGNTKIGGEITSPTWAITGNVATVTTGSVVSAWAGTVTGSINGLTVKAGGFGGSLTAGSLNTLTIAGNDTGTLRIATVKSARIVGSMQGATMTFAGGATLSLAKLAVTGSIVDSTITTSGDVGAITAGAMYGSTVSVAIGFFQPGFVNLSSTGKLNSLSLVGVGATFANSNILANSIGSLKLAEIDDANGGTHFGVSAASINSLTGTPNTGGVLRLSKAALTSSDTLSTYLTTHSLSTADFTITLT